MSIMNDMLESECRLKAEIESLRQQLSEKDALLTRVGVEYEQRMKQLSAMTADRDDCLALAKLTFARYLDSQKREVMLRDAVKYLKDEKCDYMTLNHLGNPLLEHGVILANEALAATDDLDGLILCHAEPVGSDFEGGLYRAWEQGK